MRRMKYFMVRLFISSACMVFATNLFAQQVLMKGDTLILSGEAKFWLNEEIIFGAGTMPDRTYSYIYEAPNSLQKIINNHKRKLLSPGYKGFKSKIVKFEKEVGHNKKGYDYSILVLEMPNGTKYWCDAKNAYDNHEIVINTPGNNGSQLTKSDGDNASDSKKKSSSDTQKSNSKHTKTTKSDSAPIF